MTSQNKPARCVILGGGNHAKVVIEAMQAAGIANPVAILDADQSQWGKAMYGVPIIGDDTCLQQLIDLGVTQFVVGIGSSSDMRVRRSLYELGRENGLEPISVQHPSAVVARTATIGRGSQVLAGSIVNTSCVVGANVIINTAAIAEHDCILEDHVHLATGARLAGGVLVRTGAHVGIGATVIQGIEIGNRAVVGAGAVVVRDVAPGVVVTGVPARELRRVAA